MGLDKVIDVMIWATGITLRGVEPSKDMEVSLTGTIPLGVLATAIAMAH